MHLKKNVQQLDQSLSVWLLLLQTVDYTPGTSLDILHN